MQRSSRWEANQGCNAREWHSVGCECRDSNGGQDSRSWQAQLMEYQQLTKEAYGAWYKRDDGGIDEGGQRSEGNAGLHMQAKDLSS